MNTKFPRGGEGGCRYSYSKRGMLIIFLRVEIGDLLFFRGFFGKSKVFVCYVLGIIQR